MLVDISNIRSILADVQFVVLIMFGKLKKKRSLFGHIPLTNLCAFLQKKVTVRSKLSTHSFRMIDTAYFKSNLIATGARKGSAARIS